MDSIQSRIRALEESQANHIALLQHKDRYIFQQSLQIEKLKLRLAQYEAKYGPLEEPQPQNLKSTPSSGTLARHPSDQQDKFGTASPASSYMTPMAEVPKLSTLGVDEESSESPSVATKQIVDRSLHEQNLASEFHNFLRQVNKEREDFKINLHPTGPRLSNPFSQAEDPQTSMFSEVKSYESLMSSKVLNKNLDTVKPLGSSQVEPDSYNSLAATQNERQFASNDFSKLKSTTLNFGRGNLPIIAEKKQFAQTTDLSASPDLAGSQNTERVMFTQEDRLTSRSASHQDLRKSGDKKIGRPKASKSVRSARPEVSSHEENADISSQENIGSVDSLHDTLSRDSKRRPKAKAIKMLPNQTPLLNEKRRVPKPPGVFNYSKTNPSEAFINSLRTSMVSGQVSQKSNKSSKSPKSTKSVKSAGSRKNSKGRRRSKALQALFNQQQTAISKQSSQTKVQPKFSLVSKAKDSPSPLAKGLFDTRRNTTSVVVGKSAGGPTRLLKNGSPSNLSLRQRLKLFGHSNPSNPQPKKFNVDTYNKGISLSLVTAKVSPLHQTGQDSFVPSPFNPSSGVQTPAGDPPQIMNQYTDDSFGQQHQARPSQQYSFYRNSHSQDMMLIEVNDTDCLNNDLDLSEVPEGVALDLSPEEPANLEYFSPEQFNNQRAAGFGQGKSQVSANYNSRDSLKHSKAKRLSLFSFQDEKALQEGGGQSGSKGNYFQ